MLRKEIWFSVYSMHIANQSSHIGAIECADDVCARLFPKRRTQFASKTAEDNARAEMEWVSHHIGNVVKQPDGSWVTRSIEVGE